MHVITQVKWTIDSLSQQEMMSSNVWQNKWVAKKMQICSIVLYSIAEEKQQTAIALYSIGYILTSSSIKRPKSFQQKKEQVETSTTNVQPPVKW